MAKRSRSSQQQLEILISFLENNTDLVEPRKTSQAEPIIISRKWVELVLLLNSANGPSKSIKEWKQVFADLKANVKRRARQKKSALLRPGGGPSQTKDFSEFEERILVLINMVEIKGIVLVEEPGLTLEADIVVQEVSREETPTENAVGDDKETGNIDPEISTEATLNKRQLPKRKKQSKTV